jgi:hypothetical protein
MSRESMVSKLLGELYRSMETEEPMDPRRIKRLFRLDGDFSETINRGIACHVQSADIRKERRAARASRRAR